MRARNLKPSFFKNESLAELCPLTRLLFQGLWCLADRCGRLEDRPARIKVEVLPYDECSVNEMLERLATGRFIERYEVAGCRFIQIPNFSKHAYPHVREPNSTIPAPGQNHTVTMPNRLNPESPILNPESVSCVEPQKAAASTPAPLILQGLALYVNDERLKQRINDALLSWQKAYPGVNIRVEICRAHAWEVANPQRRKVDRIKFLNNWLSRAQDQPARNGGQNGAASGKSIFTQAAELKAARDLASPRELPTAGQILHRIRNLPTVPAETGTDPSKPDR